MQIMAAESTSQIDFARQILPILSNKCFVCHGPDSDEEVDLRLDSFEAATHEQRAINPENPSESELLARISSADEPMPPADAEKQLTEKERELLKQWVLQGGEYAIHWAFVAPQKHEPKSDAEKSVIDRFVADQLLEQNINFAATADRETLARRVALVLTGLPPNVEQLETFMNNEGDEAYEHLVDQLLESPHYGEHQARYWLDAVRYGDTHGLHLDNKRGIHPYRDWVIYALNQNMPIDEFITLQLAGDLFPDPTLQQLVATGFVRMNPSTAEGGAIPEEFQAKNNFDRVETFGTVFLGLSLTCARCHTHKYDPIHQAEYYKLLAFFNSTAEHSMDGNKYDYAPVINAPNSVSDWHLWNKIEATTREILASVEIPDDLTPQWSKATETQRVEILAKDQRFADSGVQSQAAELLPHRQEMEKTFGVTLIAKELETPRVTKLLERGEYHLPVGEPLEPGVISVMGELPDSAPKNRLGLAQWLVARENPLVARVFVNRLWQRTFGYGLVRTPEDFGLQGEQPTHPELLDWLAVDLQENNWDLKKFFKQMVMSRTFQQSSKWRDDIDDPDNRLLARGSSYRLDAEVLRDIALWSSGLLDPHMGGEGIKPYQPSGMWSALMHPGSNTKNYVQDSGAKLYRRSLYVYWKRTSPHPMMTLFDAPSRESSCVRRSRTNTPLQSLGLLNETQRVEMSRALAQRLIQSYEEDSQRLDLLFHLLASRETNEIEKQVLIPMLNTSRQKFTDSPEEAKQLLSLGEYSIGDEIDPAELAAWTLLTNTVLASDAAIMLY
jgi:hypothetical protein